MATEKRLIDANEIKYILQSEPGGWGGEPQYIASKEEIDKMTTVDAVEVVHGRWLQSVPGYRICSHCMADVAIYSGHTNYCPNCGAKMDLEV